MKIKWHIKLFHKLMIYSPVLVIWIVIFLIYSIYIMDYVLILMNPSINPLISDNMVIFKHLNLPYSTTGYWLFVIINWCVFMMVISMFRTSFMDPGYLPNPVQMEFNLVRKNLEYEYEDCNEIIEVIKEKDRKGSRNFINGGNSTSSAGISAGISGGISAGNSHSDSNDDRIESPSPNENDNENENEKDNSDEFSPIIECNSGSNMSNGTEGNMGSSGTSGDMNKNNNNNNNNNSNCNNSNDGNYNPPSNNDSYTNLIKTPPQREIDNLFPRSNTNTNINIQKSSVNIHHSTSKQRYKFISNFSQFISDGPLTSSEFLKYRHNLERYLNSGINPSDRSDRINIDRIDNSISINYSRADRYSAISTNYDDIYENFRGIDFQKLIFCSTCLRWKVERSHHCKQCGKCVLKMDHHCPWLANCIGFRNYKFFCLTILYGFILTIIIFFTFWEVVIETNLRYDSSLYTCCLYSFTYICNLGMLAFLMWLFTTNWTLVFSNQTTIEKSDKERFATAEIKAFNYYDRGLYKNFVSVFGENPLFWFLPVFSNRKGDGLIFES